MILDNQILLLIACIVAIVASRTRVPYTVGLVLVGTVLSFYEMVPELQLTHELIFDLLLPPLIFEAAFHLKWKELKPIVSPVTFLATVGVLLAALVSTLILKWASGMSWQTCAIVGTVLAATDPVSVLALLKEAALPTRIHKLVEAESLFNDGVASILFAIIPLVCAGTASSSEIVTLTATGILGGVATGAVVGGAILLLSGHTSDHLVEISMTVITAFASFLAAEHLGASGILSTLTAGMVLGNFGSTGALSDKGRESAHSFWEFACFIANSFIFILIGVDLPLWSTSGAFALMSWTIIAMLIGRACAVYGGSLVFHGRGNQIHSSVQHLLFWGGLRGALSIALVLGLPEDFPDRETMIATVFYAVAFSIVVQGLTVNPLIKRVKAIAS